MKIIDKLSWIYIKDKQVLVARSKGNDVYYFPGGKREQGETDQEALLREIKEELSIDLIPETLEFINGFTAPAYGQSKGTVLKAACYSGDFRGEIKPAAEIEKTTWFTSQNKKEATPMGKIILTWLEERNLIN